MSWAGRLVGDRSRGKARDRVLPGVVARDRAIDHVAMRRALHQWHQLGRLLGQRLRGYEQPGAAIGHDIVDLGGGEARADRRVDQARALGTPADLEEARIVLEEDRDMVAGLEAERAEELRDAVGLLVELAIGHRLATAGHDVGGLVGMSAGVMIGMHDGRIRADGTDSRKRCGPFRSSALSCVRVRARKVARSSPPCRWAGRNRHRRP